MSEYIVKLSDAIDMPDMVGGERITRCRDCKHVVHRPEWQPDKRFKPIELWVCEAEWCMGFEGDHPDVTPDGFCKWGEPRGDSE